MKGQKIKKSLPDETTVYPRIMARAIIFSNKVFPQKFAATIRDCATNRVCAIIRCIIKNKLIIYF